MGDISVDSGYDKERGVIAGRSTINELSVAPNAMLHLENGGFLNTRIVKRGGYYSGGVATSQVVDGGGVGQKGEPGKDGLTPFIGENGNWWIGGLDTGVAAAGQNGSGFGNSYNHAVPWALPTASQTFTYVIRMRSDKQMIDGSEFDGSLMVDYNVPRPLCAANVGDVFYISQLSTGDYFVVVNRGDGTYNTYTYQEATQGEAQIVLENPNAKAVRILYCEAIV